eukprot:scaffold7.g3508.t1
MHADTYEQFPSGINMQVVPEQGQFMAWLVHTLRVQRIIEVGVFTGYSSTAMALALPPHGRLLACDRDPKAMALARQYWEASQGRWPRPACEGRGREAGVAGKIDERLAPASETLDALLAEPGQVGSWDFAFVDADKKGYRGYYEQLLQLVRPGGVIAVDNVLWYGRVADPEQQDANTQARRVRRRSCTLRRAGGRGGRARSRLDPERESSCEGSADPAIRELNDFLVTDERITLSIIPVGDGIALCTKR